MGGERFDYTVQKDGRVRVSWRGRCVTTVAGDRARRLAADLAAADDDGAQGLLRRVTGNFRRGNERRGGR